MEVAVEHDAVEILEAQLADLATGLDRRLARWLDLLGDFDARGGARRWGQRSTAHWLAWRCELTYRAAREHVRVARRLRELPLVRGAFHAGELSYSKVRALTRSVGEDERVLLELARGRTACELERVLRARRSSASADVAVARTGHERRFFETWWDHDGTLRLHGRLSPDDGAALVDAVETAAEAIHPPERGGPRPPLGARRADALAEIVTSGAPRAQVHLHVDEPALACTASGDEPRAGVVCAIEDGPAVPSDTARRLACDGELRTDDGRRRRVVSPPLRSSLERRDGGCRFPGCDRRHGLHAHHIRHWAHGGPTTPGNLVLLCRYHHRAVHEDGFTVEGDVTGELTFRRPDGRRLPAAPARARDPAFRRARRR